MKRKWKEVQVVEGWTFPHTEKVEFIDNATKQFSHGVLLNGVFVKKDRKETWGADWPPKRVRIIVQIEEDSHE